MNNMNNRNIIGAVHRGYGFTFNCFMRAIGAYALLVTVSIPWLS